MGHRRWMMGMVVGLIVLPVIVRAEEPQASEAEPGRIHAMQSAIESALKNMNIRGQATQELAYRVDESREWTKFRHQILLTASGSLSDALDYRITPRVYYDPVYDITDNFPHTARESQRSEIELRDTYLDYSSGEVDVRIGKQQIVWGEAVGLFFADVVNAKDLREFVLPDFDMIRIPQWGVDLEYTHGEGHLELVWLPIRDFHRLGVSGSEFHLDPTVPSGTPFTEVDPSKPPRSISNSEAGARVGYLMGGWDLGAFYFYTWDKFPVPYRTISGSTYNFVPQYRRAHIVGTSFSKEINDIVLKSELTFNPGADLQTFDTTDADGIIESPVVDYLVGADYTFGTVDTNIQLLQRVITDHPALLVEDEVRTHLSFWAKTGFLDGKLEPELLIITGLNEPDTMYRPKVTYHISETLQVRVGADIFQGRPSGVFGRFDNNSRVYTELTLYF